MVDRFTAGRRVDLGADDLSNTASRRELGLGYTIATLARHRWSGRVQQAAADPKLPLLNGEASILRFEPLALGKSLEWRSQHPPSQGMPGAREDADMHARWLRRYRLLRPDQNSRRAAAWQRRIAILVQATDRLGIHVAGCRQSELPVVKSTWGGNLAKLLFRHAKVRHKDLNSTAPQRY